MTNATYGLSRRRLFGLGAAGISAAALAGCSGPSTTGAGTEQAQTEDYSGVKPAANIDFWSVHPGASQEVETQLVKAFNASQSDTTVKLVTAGANYGDVAQKFQTAQQSKNLPGVIVLGSGFWFTYKLNNSIVDLTELVKATDTDVSDYNETLWSDYTYDQKQWAVPYARSTPIFYYNKSHFRQAGLPDRGPKTWMEFGEWATKLDSADTGAKHVFEFDHPNTAATWAFEGNVWGWGGNYSKKFDFTMSEPGTIAAFEWGRKAIFTDKWAALAATPSGATTDMGGGAVTAIVGSTGSLKGILESSKGKFEVGTAFLPGGPKTTDNVCPTGGSGIAIPAAITPEEQLAAMNFIKFLTNPENTVTFAQATGYMPVRTSADAAPLIEQTPQVKTAIDQLPHTRSEDYARMFVPGGNKILDDALFTLFSKPGADIDKVMADTDSKLKTVYERDVKPAL